MYALYQNTANSTTGGTQLSSTVQNVEIVKIIVGAPVANGNIWIYDINNVGNVTNTTGLVSKLTLPSSFATGQLPFTIDLTDAQGHGIILKGGGTVAIDQAIQATFVWGYSQQESNTI